MTRRLRAGVVWAKLDVGSAVAAPAAAKLAKKPRRETPQQGPVHTTGSSAPTALASNFDM
ncbi:hypothetical protein OY671_012494, partial [Metschnikowia pulcherrima]